MNDNVNDNVNGIFEIVEVPPALSSLAVADLGCDQAGCCNCSSFEEISCSGCGACGNA